MRNESAAKFFKTNFENHKVQFFFFNSNSVVFMEIPKITLSVQK